GQSRTVPGMGTAHGALIGGDIPAPNRRLFAILWHPHVETEPALNAAFVRGEEWWFDDVHLISYVTPAKLTDTLRDVNRLGGEQLSAIRYSRAEIRPAGGMIVELEWSLTDAARESASLRTVLELYDSTGAL